MYTGIKRRQQLWTERNRILIKQKIEEMDGICFVLDYIFFEWKFFLSQLREKPANAKEGMKQKTRCKSISHSIKKFK